MIKLRGATVLNEQYINELIDQGYIAKKYSEDGKLYLMNYTNKCIYDKKWNKYTLNARGHVYDVETNELIANPFPKFFNLMELATSKSRNLIKKKNYSCYEKLDGSLGIIYYYNGEWHCNTRGSFNSEQSIECLKMLNELYDLENLIYDKDITILVEIIYPENRIVMDYGDKRGLVLLSAYITEHQQELSRVELLKLSGLTGIPLVKKHNLTFECMFKFQEAKEFDKEGFVVQFGNGYRVKIKSKEYLKIARLMNNMSPKNIWENMVEGKVKVESLELLPEEFRKDIDYIVDKLEFKYLVLKESILEEYNELMLNEPTRKDIGLNKELQHKGAIFSLLDEKLDKFDNYIWKQIKPEVSK